MTRKQLENRYQANELYDYKLSSSDDLLRVHKIDITKVSGYESLDEVNRTNFENFIVNFFNAWGLDSRLKIMPKSVRYVEEEQYLKFEYQRTDYEGNLQEDWLHVIKEGREWY